MSLDSSLFTSTKEFCFFRSGYEPKLLVRRPLVLPWLVGWSYAWCWREATEVQRVRPCSGVPSPSCFTLPGPPPSYPPGCYVYTPYPFNTHIPPSNVFILLHMFCKSPTKVPFPSLLWEARSTILLCIPSQWENADAWQVAPKTPTEKKEYLENVLRIGANAKAQESQDRHVTSKCTANHSSDSLTIRHTSMETASPHLFIFCV